MKSIGRKYREWMKARAILKEEFAEKEITRCELCNSDYILSFHHRNKRRKNDPHIFENVILVCANCHHMLEYDRELTDDWFSQLRPERKNDS